METQEEKAYQTQTLKNLHFQLTYFTAAQVIDCDIGKWLVYAQQLPLDDSSHAAPQRSQ